MSYVPAIVGLIVVSYLGCLRGFSEKDGKIIGGMRAIRGEYPFVVKVIGIVGCGGSLVTFSKIVTAGHCVVFFNGSGHAEYINLTTARVIGGVVDWKNRRDEYYQSRRIANYKLHAGYRQRECGAPFHDISVANLTQSFDPSPTVRPMSIVSGNPDVFKQAWDCMKGAQCVTVGWGKTEYNMTNGTVVAILPSRYLKVIELIPLPNQVCGVGPCSSDTEAYSLGEVCLKARYPNQAPSKGDSGGPLICKGHVYGVLSSAHLDPTFQRPSYCFLLWKYLEEFGIAQDQRGRKNCSPDTNHNLLLLLLLIILP